MQYKRISADCHLDMIWLPPDLFTSQAPRDLKDRMPFVAEGLDGKEWVAKNGAWFGLIGGVGAAGRLYEPGKGHRADRMAEAGLYDDGLKGIRRPGDPDLRVKDMDRDGIDAEVIYGILAAAAKLKDCEASNEMLQIFNDFMHDFCKHYANRLYRPREHPIRRHGGRGRRGSSRREDGLQGPRAVMLLGHAADVAPELEPAVAGDQRHAAATTLPYLPVGRPEAAGRRPGRVGA